VDLQANQGKRLTNLLEIVVRVVKVELTRATILVLREALMAVINTKVRNTRQLVIAKDLMLGL
jgi:hypothetical protein